MMEIGWIHAYSLQSDMTLQRHPNECMGVHEYLGVGASAP